VMHTDMGYPLDIGRRPADGATLREFNGPAI
jgi:hypothetical protein